jgi:hypothetical protein
MSGEKPDQQNSLSLLCESVERGSKIGMIIMVLPVLCPHAWGKRTGEDPTKLHSYSHPSGWGNEERVGEKYLECK